MGNDKEEEANQASALSFGDLLQKRRLERNLTQKELADKSGVTERAISKLEARRTKHPRKDTVDLLADALDLQGDVRTEFEEAAGKVKRRPRSPARLSEVLPLTGPAPQPTEGAATIPMGPITPLAPLDAPVPVDDLQGVEDDVEEGGVPWVRVALVAAGVAALVAVVAIMIVPRLIPAPAAVTAPTRGTSYLAIVDGVDGLQLSGMSRREDGLLFVEVGQPITASFTVVNTAPSGGPTGIMQAVVASARGPDGCRSWSGTNADFPQVAGPIVLPPGQTHRYEKSDTFTMPGVYFVEPTKEGADGVWGGLRPYPRTYFVVVGAEEAKAGRWPATECITPVPAP